MFSYLVLFAKNMIDFNDTTTKGWLRKLSNEGRVISVDEVDGSVNATKSDSYDLELRGFAIINAANDEEINSILSTCPNFNRNDIRTYKLSS